MTRDELSQFPKEEGIVLRAEVWDFIEKLEEQNSRKLLLLKMLKNLRYETSMYYTGKLFALIESIEGTDKEAKG